MIAARYMQGGTLEIGEAPRPEIEEGELLLRVEAASICGSDVKIVRHGHRKLRAGQRIILGHEFVGVIERAGPFAGPYPEGARVGVAPNIGCGVCGMCGRGSMNMCPDFSAFGIDRDGAHTEFVRIPQAAVAQGSVIPIPDGVTPAEATLAEPLSCVINSIRSLRIAPGETVLVYGSGPMGLLHVMLAAVSGASRVIAVDINEERLRQAAGLGATDTVNSQEEPVPEWVADTTNGLGIDAVITAAPIKELQEEGLSLLAPFGRLCLFAGLPRGAPAVRLDTNAIHYRNLVVTGVTGGSPRDYRAALNLIESRKVDVTRIVSHTFPLHEMARAYEVALSGKGMKVVMTAA